MEPKTVSEILRECERTTSRIAELISTTLRVHLVTSFALCAKCKYCRWIDVDGHVDCDRFVSGKAKIYCEKFEEKTSKKEG